MSMCVCCVAHGAMQCTEGNVHLLYIKHAERFFTCVIFWFSDELAIGVKDVCVTHLFVGVPCIHFLYDLKLLCFQRFSFVIL